MRIDVLEMSWKVGKVRLNFPPKLGSFFSSRHIIVASCPTNVFPVAVSKIAKARRSTSTTANGSAKKGI